MMQPSWVDADGRVVCARCSERRGYSYDRESGEPICIDCQIASMDAAERVFRGLV